MNEGINLYKPAKARAALPKEELWHDGYIAEEKLNGARYLMYLGYDPYGRNTLLNTFLSRRESKRDGLFVDKSRQLIHIAKPKYRAFEDTVLDGEVIIPGRNLYTINGVMNSLPEESQRKQRELGMVEYHVFDILRYKGVDLTEVPLHERRKYYSSVALQILPAQSRYIKFVPPIMKDFRGAFDTIVQAGGEGIIIKDMHAVYGKGWSKMKKSHDCSAIVMGYKEGIGKYFGMMGALQLGVYHNGELVEVAFASGMTDGLRQEITDDPNKFKGLVVDIYAQELTSGSLTTVGRLQHPTFYRFRDDVEPTEVTWAAMWESFEINLVKSKRDRS